MERELHCTLIFLDSLYAEPFIEETTAFLPEKVSYFQSFINNLRFLNALFTITVVKGALNNDT